MIGILTALFNKQVPLLTADRQPTQLLIDAATLTAQLRAGKITGFEYWAGKEEPDLSPLALWKLLKKTGLALKMHFGPTDFPLHARLSATPA